MTFDGQHFSCVSAGTVPHPENSALKKEVEDLKQQEEELTTRMAALEAELAMSCSSKADHVAQIAELKRSVQVRGLYMLFQACWVSAESQRYS